jgi:hypothetical protein
MRGRMTPRGTECSMPRRQVGSTRGPLCRLVIRSVEVPSLAGSGLSQTSLIFLRPPHALGEVSWLIPASRGQQCRFWFWFDSGGSGLSWRVVFQACEIKGVRHSREEFVAKRRRPVSPFPWSPGQPLNLSQLHPYLRAGESLEHGH